jgi:hypothetical protein
MLRVPDRRRLRELTLVEGRNVQSLAGTAEVRKPDVLVRASINCMVFLDPRRAYAPAYPGV